MKVQILNQNLQGANNALMPLRIRNYYHHHRSQLDVLCFQEHKLRGDKLRDFGNKVWRDATYLGCEASPGYNHLDGQEGVGKGGICMFISPKLAPYIHSHGNIGGNLVQWVHFKNLPGGDVAIANIYAPHSSPIVRAQLWQDLVRALHPDFRWILCGDWNMVESHKDKSSSCGHILSGMEKFEFDRLKAHCQVEDYFNYSSPLNFSWDNKRKDGPRVLARLDRFYSFTNLDPNQSTHITSYDILGDCGLSDHLPIRLVIQLQVPNVKGSNYKMNGAYLKDPLVIDQLKNIWISAPPSLEFFGKIRRVVKFYKFLCKQKASSNREGKQFEGSASSSSDSSTEPAKPSHSGDCSAERQSRGPRLAGRPHPRDQQQSIRD